ncbi:MAG: signal transduction histidine kinase/ligand-binding sensor domain-containing protein [Candidatus Krumholzibacteriia bacterium]|jgi:signal transduction histidine kinase/ligand-binding sensor domain-containing protein/DNA-binding response OmpR family regulator
MLRSPIRVILLFFTLANVAAAATPLRFEHLTINDGLPENSVRSILQDRHGFLWFGTQNGVARYDGTGMRVHLPDPDDPNSIDLRFVLAMAEDDTGAIWMGSYSAGVSRYNPRTETFTNFSADGDSLPGPGVADIRAAADGVWVTSGDGGLYRAHGSQFERIAVPPFDALTENANLSGLNVSPQELWVGSSRHGVALQDRVTGAWQHLQAEPGNAGSLPSNFVTFVHRDLLGRVWIGSRAGLALYRGDGSFATFQPRPDLGESDLNYLVCITADPQGGFWIGAAVGLYHFDPVTGEFTLHTHDPDQADSPVRGPVLSILCDQAGVIWAGSWHTGMNKYNPGAAKFKVYLHDAADPGSLDDDAIGAIYEDSQGTLWVGTGSRSSGGTVGGVNFRAKGQTGFAHIPFPEQSETRVRTVNVIREDRDGRIWLGTNQGLWQVAAAGDQVLRPQAMENAPAALFNGMVTDLTFDASGRLWVACWTGGLHRLDPMTGSWTSYLADPSQPGSLLRDDLTAVCIDGLGRLWVGSDGGGLQVYDPALDSFHDDLETGVSLETIFQIIPAGRDRVYVSSGAGILLCDRTTVFKRYTTRTGLPSDFAGRIVLDQAGDLWASTGLGLARIDAQSDSVTVFDERDGLPRNEVHFGVLRTQDGHLYFGGHHGLVSFHPDSLAINSHVPPVRITEVKINDEPLSVGIHSPLNESLSLTEEIRLGPNQNDISLRFAALDFAVPERNRYRYQLVPGDDTWRVTHEVPTAHYTNLDPGHYTFAVMGSNGDGVWNDTATYLGLVIAPPWHQTVWAILLYVLAVVAAMFLSYRLLLNRERMRMALELERSEASHLQNLDQLKSRFFANISHEFRTPLTLLMSPLRRLQDDPSSGTPELFGTMSRNARRLGRLIDQLLDLSRLEADRMPSRWRHGEWCRYMRVLSSSFKSLAEQRGLVLESVWPSEVTEAWYDPDLVDKILVNLLSNAVKFTPSGGEVSLTVTVSEKSRRLIWPGLPEGEENMGEALMMTIEVHNTGSHISSADLENVFDRFQQVIDNPDFGDLGSGIGLALVKELAEWCGGEVRVHSTAQAGTTFKATLPLFVTPPPPGVLGAGPEVEREEDEDEHLDAQVMDEADETEDSDLGTLLVVEDNSDLRNYIREELSDEYRILTAANGKTGLELARTEIPDLVLSDVMMPEIDGLTLCSALKSGDLTNHIPVILLTAKAEAASRREGLETGADDYVAKPFDVLELRIRIRNLIEQRRLLAERYDKLEVVRPGRVANPVPSADDRFLERAREVIASNLEDPDFRVEALCREIGMSRTQLHRKLKAVAGRSAGDFLRAERLNKAADMLGKGECNVTEAAYSVGYRSLSQFAKAFREQFGMAPSDFEV